MSLLRARHLLHALAIGAMLAPEMVLAQERFEGSLLFSAREQQIIERMFGLQPTGAASDDFESPEIDVPASLPVWSIERVQLTAMIYVSAVEWTLWLSGERIEPGRLPAHFSDLRVTPNYIDISVIRRPGTAPVPVRLRPNQTFLVAEQRIIEDGGFAR